MAPADQEAEQAAWAGRKQIVDVGGLDLAYVEIAGAGRFQVEGRTARDVFPGRTMVLPAGSLVEGAALKEHGVWTVHWSDIIVRGVRVPISAISVIPPGTSLRGNTVLARVQ